MIDIVVFFVITVFIILKLKSVLGTRNDTDNVRQKTLDEFFKNQMNKNNNKDNNDKIIDITNQINKNKDDKNKNLELDIKVDDNVEKELKKINFDEKKFLKGAENAVEMVNEAFSNKDLDTLKELLVAKLFNNFKKQIEELNNQNRILKSSLISFLSKKIEDIKIINKNICINMLFEMEQINFVEDQDGNIIMGNKKQIQKVKEKWTFEKKVGDKTNFWIIKNIENIN